MSIEPSEPRVTVSYSFVSSRAIGDLPVVAARRGEIVHGALDAVRRLVDHHGPRFGRDVGQTTRTFLARTRKKALEHVARRREPRDHERGHGCDRSGHGRHAEAGVERRPHQSFAGVGDARRAGVGDERDVVAGEQCLEHVVDATQLGVLVAHREAGGSDAGVLEQPARPPGVLAAHERRRSRGPRRREARGRRGCRSVSRRGGGWGRPRSRVVVPNLDDVTDLESPSFERAGLGLDHRPARSTPASRCDVAASAPSSGPRPRRRGRRHRVGNEARSCGPSGTDAAPAHPRIRRVRAGHCAVRIDWTPRPPRRSTRASLTNHGTSEVCHDRRPSRVPVLRAGARKGNERCP